MKILLTGASGFLGENLLPYLVDHEVITLSRKSNQLAVDLQFSVPNLPYCDIVIHAAGKAHSIPKTDEEKNIFFLVNVTGTINLLKGLKQNKILPTAFVLISSVSVYGQFSGIMINEDFDLLARDAYGLSKIEAEREVLKWCTQNGVICTILRLPLLAGKNPPGNLNSLIKSIRKGYYLNIARGNAQKSIVLVDDVAQIIIIAARTGGIYNLTDGVNPKFGQLAQVIAKQLGKNKPGYDISYNLAVVLAKLGDLFRLNIFNSDKLLKITSSLTFDDSKARAAFNWNPNSILANFKIN